MAYDKVVDSASLDSKLTQVADAIRTKGNTSADLQFPSGFISAIQAIQTGTELQIIVTVKSGATVTATKGSKVVSGTSVNGTCTLVVPEEGDWTVSATLGGETSPVKTVSVVSAYNTDLVFASDTLNGNPWYVIRDASDKGQAENLWSIGDRKSIVLNGTIGKLSLSNYETYAFIIGFNHNSNLEGTNRIHFQLGKTEISDGIDIAFSNDSNRYGSLAVGNGYFSMSSNSPNAGGWQSSQMRAIICGISLEHYTGTFIGAIPEELRVVLKSVTKYTNNIGNSSDTTAVTATTDYFFLLSPFEVTGSVGLANPYEKNVQKQYSYYSAGNSKIKYRHNSTSTAAYWWLRSPYAAETKYFICISPNGRLDTGMSNNIFTCAPGFCV